MGRSNTGEHTQDASTNLLMGLMAIRSFLATAGMVSAPGGAPGPDSPFSVSSVARPRPALRIIVVMKAIATTIALCASLLVHAQTPSAKSAPAQSSTAKTGAAHTSARPRPSLLNPASLTAKAPADFKAKFSTTAGDFVVEVHRDWAPLGADRFYNLVRNGYFTNAAFFRVVSGFVVQFGLSADPAVNKVWHEARIQDDPVVQSNKRGTLVFATAGPNTRTTQLFINYADNTRLNGMGFAPFGTVVEGMDVVNKIYPGYRESPRQDLIADQGDAYLKANFPDMDKIKAARILPALSPAATGAKSAAKPATKPAQH